MSNREEIARLAAAHGVADSPNELNVMEHRRIFDLVQAATEASDAKWQARVKELEEAIQHRLNADKYCAQYAHLPDSEEDRAQACQDADDALIKALSTTSPDQALQRALVEARIDELEMALGRSDISIKARLECVRKKLEELGG